MRSGLSEAGPGVRDPADLARRGKGTTLIVGVGNELLGDEGLGVHVVRRLLAMKDRLPPGAEVLEAGIFLMNSLGEISAYPHVILVDAVRAGGKPGRIYRVEIEEGLADCLPDVGALSLHQWGVAESLYAAEVLGLLPARVTLVGAEPERIEPGTELSPTLEPVRDRIVSLLLEEVVGVSERRVSRGAALPPSS